MLRFGKICELGTGVNLGFARVNFDDIEIVSAWLSLPSFGTKNIKKWCSIPVNTQVAVNMHDDGEQGIIIDCLWSKTDTPPTWANANTDGIQFADGTKIYYDNSSHELTINLGSGTIIFNGGNNDGMVKVNSLVSKLNTLENRANAIVASFTTLSTAMTALGAVPVLGTVLGAAIVTATATVITPIVPTIKANLENTKIKQ